MSGHIPHSAREYMGAKWREAFTDGSVASVPQGCALTSKRVRDIVRRMPKRDRHHYMMAMFGNFDAASKAFRLLLPRGSLKRASDRDIRDAISKLLPETERLLDEAFEAMRKEEA